MDHCEREKRKTNPRETASFCSLLMFTVEKINEVIEIVFHAGVKFKGFRILQTLYPMLISKESVTKVVLDIVLSVTEHMGCLLDRRLSILLLILCSIKLHGYEFLLSYTGSLFKKAYKNDLEEEDLYEVLRQCGSKRCGDKIETRWNTQNKKDDSPSIYMLLIKRYGLRYLSITMVHLIWKIFMSIVEPWAISNLIAYFTPGQTKYTKYDAYIYASLLLTITAASCVYVHNYVLWAIQLGVEIKTSFSSLLYRKALKLSPSAILDISLGNIVTLITKDVNTFQLSMWMLNDVWIGSIQACVICFLLYAKIGSLSFVGVGILLSALPVQIIIGKYISKMRLITGRKTDERIQVTQETLSAIRIIKMYTWEKYFGDRITASRITEMNKMLLGFYLKICVVILGILFSKIGLYALIMAYVWSGGTADSQTIFYIITLFKDLKNSLGAHIPHGMARAAEFYSAMTRIDKVISSEELQPKQFSDEPTLKPLVELKNAMVHIRDTEILKNVSLEIDSGLILVTGAVGSGKSSLLKAMLQDYPLSSGSVLTLGRISYASQDPWLFPSSIKQNITFGQSYDEKRYLEVIRVCALQYDFSLFEKGDETIVTDKGLNLSKGQQARVNLARAIYKESEIYLLDDSLTALDAHVQDFIFNECIKTHLKGKICILVTQTVKHIREADKVVIMDKGQIKDYGKPNEEIIKEVNEVVIEDDDIEKEVIEENKENVEDERNNVENEKLFETEQTTRRKVYGEVKKKGKVDILTYKRYFLFGGGILLMLLNIFLFGITQGTDSYSDQLLTQWVDEQHDIIALRNNISNLPVDQILNRNFSDLPRLNETTVELEGHFMLSPTTAVSTMKTVLQHNNMSEMINFTNNATENLLERAIEKGQSTIKLYSIIIFVSTLFAMLKTYAVFDYCRRASINIHNAMVQNITGAVMSFFDTHFIGNILNRFSQDLNNIDELLPMTFSEIFRVLFSVLGIVFLIATVNADFLIYSGIFAACAYILRFYYLPLGRSLKRLEAATRSPMIGHLNASLEGLTTIRAYKAESILIEEFDRHQDLYTSAHYTAFGASRAFGLYIDFCCTLLITVLVIKFLFIDTDLTAGKVGLALTQAFMLAHHVQWGVRQWAELENLMTSVERLLEYTEIEPESKEGTEVNYWPTKGVIKYENVYLTYNNNEIVLKNLNFEVESKQKIGIVGRTGAGKSSIISTMFRLYDVEGKILIDGINTKTLSLKFLRQKLAIIPQDPVLFSGTVRTNIDPFGEYSDEDLWKALDKVGLRKILSSLDSKITASGTNFSSGQKQLVCLSRAILRKVKIVILDEATANMDPETDALLHQTIKENFSTCTVFAIAHRLHSILDCDKVMVLDRGEIKEFDKPTSLLQKKNGMFYRMVEQAGLLDYLS